jgi:hypothetical protein
MVRGIIMGIELLEGLLPDFEIYGDSIGLLVLNGPDDPLSPSILLNILGWRDHDRRYKYYLPLFPSKIKIFDDLYGKGNYRFCSSRLLRITWSTISPQKIHLQPKKSSQYP